MQAMLVIFEGFTLLFGLGARLLQALAGAEAVIRVAGFDQLSGIGQIHVLALGLNVRAARAADIRALVV